MQKIDMREFEDNFKLASAEKAAEADDATLRRPDSAYRSRVGR